MSGRLKLSDAELAEAGQALVAACSVMTSGGRTPDGGLPSLTGIGPEVDLHVRGLMVARAALADAAKTASESVASVMHDSGALDAAIADALYEGFAVKGGAKE